MNKSKIVEFEVGKNKGLFISVPYNYKNFKIQHYSKRFGTYLIETDSKNLNSWKIIIPESSYDIIGLSHKLKPELIKNKLGISFKDYMKILNKKDITVNYSDSSNLWLVLLLTEC